MPYLLSAMRDHLVSAGVVRKPSVPGVLPPLWVERAEGVPGPRDTGVSAAERGDPVLGAFFSGGVPPEAYESFLRQDTVDIWIRATNATRVFDLDDQLRSELVDKRNWNMGGLNILESLQWRALQRSTSSDEAGFTFIVSFMFWTGGHT